MNTHSEKYEALFVLDVFANRRAWLEKAQLAYHAYGQSTNFKNYQGLPMPEWEKLPEPIQVAWGEAVKAVILDERKSVVKPAFGTHSGGA